MEYFKGKLQTPGMGAFLPLLLIAFLCHCSSSKKAVETDVEDKTSSTVVPQKQPDVNTNNDQIPGATKEQDLPTRPIKTENTNRPTSSPTTSNTTSGNQPSPAVATLGTQALLTRYVRVAIPTHFDEKIKALLLQKIKKVIDQASREASVSMQTQFIFTEALPWTLAEGDKVDPDALAKSFPISANEPHTITLGLDSIEIGVEKLEYFAGLSLRFRPWITMSLITNLRPKVEEEMSKSDVRTFLHEYLHAMGASHIIDSIPSIMNKEENATDRQKSSNNSQEEIVQVENPLGLIFDTYSKGIISQSVSTTFSATCEVMPLQTFAGFVRLMETHSTNLETENADVGLEETESEAKAREKTEYIANALSRAYTPTEQTLLNAHVVLTTTVADFFGSRAYQLTDRDRTGDARRCLDYLKAIESSLKKPMDAPRSKCVQRKILMHEHLKLSAQTKKAQAERKKMRDNHETGQNYNTLHEKIEADVVILNGWAEQIRRLPSCDTPPYNT